MTTDLRATATQGHRHERVEIAGRDGPLAATLHLPGGRPRGAVLVAHCFTCSRSFTTIQRLSSGIEQAGWAALRFDFTGLGESAGDFATTTVTTNIDDIVTAARYLERRELGPLVLVGHSLGGAAVLLAAHAVPAARAVAVLAAPFGPEHVRGLFSTADRERVFAAGRATVTIGGRPFEVAESFFNDLERHEPARAIARLGRPLLVVHGTADRTVAIAEGERILAAAAQPRWFAAVPGADHLFLTDGAIDAAARVIRTFLDTVLPAADTPQESD